MAENTTLARPYAKGVFELSGDAESRERWSRSLATLAAIARHEDMQSVVASPRVSPEQMVEMIRELAGDELGEQGLNLVRLLAENRRLGLLPEIAALYEQLRAEAEGTVDVEVVSSHPLSDAQKERIAAALEKRLGRSVRLHPQVDESMLGGAIIRAGDLVIDGSVRGKLNRLTSALVH